jgi:Cytochrome P450
MSSSYVASLLTMPLHTAALPALALVGFLLYRYLLYPAFFSPLARIPTPHPLASVVRFWLDAKERSGCQARSLVAAHRRLGPIIRVEPNHVHTASLDGLRVVFHVGRFERTDFFQPFRNYNGTHNMLTMMDAKEHAVRRRIVSHVYSKSFILASPDFQRMSHVILYERLLPHFDESSETGRGVDVFELSYALSVEFMSAYQVGTGHNLDIVRKGTEARRREYVFHGQRKLRETEGYKVSIKILEDQNLVMHNKADAFLSSAEEKKEADSTYPVVYALMKDAVPKKENPKSAEEARLLVASETLDNLEAARVGVGTALTYILHELTLRPAVQAALRAELLTLPPPFSHPPGPDCAIDTATLRALDALPMLDAVITETLRLRNPVLLLSRRVVPPGGAVVDGCFLPGGTEISASTHVMHMNEEVFPEPDRWDYERWMGLPTGKGEERAENDPRRWFWTFITGSFMCVGNNFAMMGEYFWTMVLMVR